MRTLGYEISDDGITQWRKNGGSIERRAFYASGKWEDVMLTSDCPRTTGQLKKQLLETGFGFAKTMREARKIGRI